MNRVLPAAFAALGCALAFAAPSGAEPMFLSRQHARCTTCHYSPTGGGLLTPYGRSLSRHELSLSGKGAPGQDGAGREERFLWGALGEATGPLALGIDLRPSTLRATVGEQSTDRNLLMTADLIAAYRAHGWTLYAQLGRQPRIEGRTEGARINSYEYWVGYESARGLGFRAGRFLPAYGVRLADHTAFTREGLGLSMYDQVFGLELSHTGGRHLAQLSLGPGRADSLIDDDGAQAFTATARVQTDLAPRTVLVLSGLYRAEAREAPRSGAAGVAFGFAPLSRLSVWTEANATAIEGPGGPPAYILLNDTSIEVARGIWLKVSPQLLTEQGDPSAGIFRMVLGAELLLRTHWHVHLSYYRDEVRGSSLSSDTYLAQLHLYL